MEEFLASGKLMGPLCRCDHEKEHHTIISNQVLHIVFSHESLRLGIFCLALPVVELLCFQDVFFFFFFYGFLALFHEFFLDFFCVFGHVLDIFGPSFSPEFPAATG